MGFAIQHAIKERENEQARLYSVKQSLPSYSVREGLEKNVINASKSRLTIIARDARCIFVYPDFTEKAKEKLRNAQGENINGYLILKKSRPFIPYFLISGMKYDFEFNIKDSNPHLYIIEGVEPGSTYKVKFKAEGIKSLRSNEIKTPVNYVSSDTSCKFATQKELLLK